MREVGGVGVLSRVYLFINDHHTSLTRANKAN